MDSGQRRQRHMRHTKMMPLRGEANIGPAQQVPVGVVPANFHDAAGDRGGRR
jgi:hypothetical protein